MTETSKNAASPGSVVVTPGGLEPFQFSSPQFLWWFVILIPVIWILRLGWGLATARLRFFGHAGDRPRAMVRPRERFQRVLLLASLSAMLLALAGPRYGFEEVEVRSAGADIFVALDLSNSMLAADVRPSRFDRARREVFDLLDLIDASGRTDRIGIVGFAGISFVQCPLTSDTNAVREYLRLMSPTDMPAQGTDVGGAIRTALEAMAAGSIGGIGGDAANSQALILISDGEDFEGDVNAAVKEAAERGIRIYTVGVGTSEGAPVPAPDGGLKKDAGGNVVISRFSGQGLASIAEATDGKYLNLASGTNIESLEFVRVLGQNERESGRLRYWHEKFQWPLGIAALLVTFFAVIPVRSVIPLIVWLMIGAGLGMVTAVWPGPTVYAAAEPEAQKQGPGSAREQRKIYNQGIDAYERGDFGAAREFFEQAGRTIGGGLVDKGAGDTEASKFAADALYNKGNAAVSSGDLQAAEQAYQESLKLNPTDQQAEENLAWVREQLQQQQKSSGQDQNEQNQSDERDSSKSNPNTGSNEQESGQKESGQKESGHKESGQKESGQKESGQKESGQVDSQGQTNKPDADEQAQRLSADQARKLLNSVDDFKSKYLYFVLPKDQQEKAKKPGGRDW